MSAPEEIAVADIPRRLRPGMTVYLQGGTGESKALAQAFAAAPDSLAGVRLVSQLLPGINGFDYAALHPEARQVVFMASPALAATIADGRTTVLPLSYGQAARWLEALEPDLAVLSLTPPDAGGCGFGASADFGPIVAPHARVRIGVLNRAGPRPNRGPRLPMAQLQAAAESEEPLALDTPEPGYALSVLAARVAELVPDRACVETGIGAAPLAVWRALKGHRGLRLQSGMVTDGFLDALEAGAAQPAGHVAGIAVGGARLAAALDGTDLVAFADVRTTHDVGRLGALERFTAINGALEVDLFGQANLERLNGRAVSGVGGAPEFGRAAGISRGGRSILALQSTAAGGTVSRIRLRLDGPVSLSRTEVDTVVTEHGAAELRGLDLDGRAQALIAIAAPEHRGALAAEWDAFRRS